MTKKTTNPADLSDEDFFNTSSTIPAVEQIYGDPYYDHTKPVLISPEDVTGRTQKMHVTFKDQNFRNDYHVQWVEESKFSEYCARGFQCVKKDWIASSWTHALTESNNDLSDKIRMAVGIGEGGATQYNILMFTTKALFDRMQTAAHNSFNSLLTVKDDQFENLRTSVIDVDKIKKMRFQ